MCPYYLDGDLLTGPRKGGPVGDTRQSDPMSMGPTADAAARRVSARLRGYCAVFKGRPRGRALRPGTGGPASCAGLSKLNSMHRARARRNAELARSGLVDVPG